MNSMKVLTHERGTVQRVVIDSCDSSTCCICQKDSCDRFQALQTGEKTFQQRIRNMQLRWCLRWTSCQQGKSCRMRRFVHCTAARKTLNERALDLIAARFAGLTQDICRPGMDRKQKHFQLRHIDVARS